MPPRHLSIICSVRILALMVCCRWAAAGQNRERGAMRDDEGDETGAVGEDEVSGAVREDGPNGRAGAGFDPTPYLRQLRGPAGGQD